MRAVGYIRVSTREQGDSGLSLAAQKRELYSDVARRDGWELATIVSEVASSSTIARRPELLRLLDQLDAGDYGALVVKRLDRLTRSLLDFAVTMDRAHRHGWSLVVLDSGVDMTTPWGRALAGMAAVWAQLQRELMAENTREGLAEARRRGTFRPGEHNRYGMRPIDPDDLTKGYEVDEEAMVTIERIVRLRRSRGAAAVAAMLNDEGHPGPTGRGWHPRTVARITSRASH